jgi:hypothetical protein
VPSSIIYIMLANWLGDGWGPPTARVPGQVLDMGSFATKTVARHQETSSSFSRRVGFRRGAWANGSSPTPKARAANAPLLMFAALSAIVF